MLHKIVCTLAFTTLVVVNAAANTPTGVPQEVNDEFHFVVLGDSQFDKPAVFNRVIDQTRRLRPAFVIQVGDMIQGYNNNLAEVEQEWTRYKAQIAPLGPIAFLPVPGNHDTFGGNKKPSPELHDLYEGHWGPLQFSFTYKNTLIVGLNSDALGAQNQISGEQWAWLAQTLNDSQAEHKMLFMHRPPMLMSNAAELHDLMKSHGVSHVFYGHHHHYHHFMQDGIAYTMTNAAANSVHQREEVGGFAHLLQVSIRGAEVDVAVIKADAIKPQDAVVAKDNYDYFLLDRNLAPRSILLSSRPATETGADETRYHMEIPLRNGSDRDIEVLLSCGSADQRWVFDPVVIAPIELKPKASQTLTLGASYRQDRVPESLPRCELRVPFQTGKGVWIDYEQTIDAAYPPKS